MGANIQIELPTLPDADTVLERGRELISAREHEAAKVLLSDAVVSYPTDARLINALGAAEARLENHGTAFGLFLYAARLEKDTNQKYKYTRNALQLAMKRETPIRMSLLVRQLRKFQQSEEDYLVAKAEYAAQGMLERFHLLDRVGSKFNRLADTADRHHEVQMFEDHTSNLLSEIESSDVETNHLRTLINRVQIYEKEGRWGACYRVACHLIERNEYSIDVLFSKMNACAALGKVNEAIEIASHICSLTESKELNVELLSTIAKLLDIHDDAANAVLVLEKAIGLSGEHVSDDLLKRLAELYQYDNGKHAAFERIIELCKRLYPAATWHRYMSAQSESEYGNFFNAIEILEGLLLIEPENADALNLLGCLYSDVKNMTKAEQSFTRAIKCNPTFYNARYNLAWLHNTNGRHERAIELYAELLREQPFNAVLWNNYGVALSRLGKRRLSRKCHETAYELDSKNPDVLFNLGNEYKQSGELEAAQAFLQKLVELNPEEAIAKFQLGDIAYLADRFDEARKCFEASLAIDVFAPSQFTRLSVVCEQVDDWEAVRKYSEIGLDHFPNDPIINFNAGVTASHFKAYDAAKEHFQNCIKLDPKYVGAHNSLGWINFSVGDVENAKKSFLDALEIDRHYVNSIFNLGLCHFAFHQISDAERYFSLATEKQPNHNLGHLFLAVVLMLKGFPELAAKRLKQIRSDQTFSAEWSPFNVISKLVDGAYVEAINDLEGLKPTDSIQSIALILRAYAHSMLGQKTRSDADFQAAISSLPSLEYFKISVQIIASVNAQVDILIDSLRQAVTHRKVVPIDALRILREKEVIEKLLSLQKEKKKE